MVTMIAPSPGQVEIPTHRQMSYEDYLNFAPNSQIAEWVKGEVITYMPPQYIHQDIITFLGTLLRLFIKSFNAGIVIFAPFEVKLWSGGPSREPDIIFIAQERLDILTEKRVEGAPDLVIEIISPGSVTEDRIRKFTEYEQAGVREYWVIDPRPYQQQADFYILGEDKQYQAAPVDNAGGYHAAVVPGFWFKIDWLWQKTLPNPQAAFAEIILSTPNLPPEVSTAYQTIRQWLERENNR